MCFQSVLENKNRQGLRSTYDRNPFKRASLIAVEQSQSVSRRLLRVPPRCTVTVTAWDAVHPMC